jgi:ABC-type uncharacterized transport system substrate-binding protein
MITAKRARELYIKNIEKASNIKLEEYMIKIDKEVDNSIKELKDYAVIYYPEPKCINKIIYPKIKEQYKRLGYSVRINKDYGTYLLIKW